MKASPTSLLHRRQFIKAAAVTGLALTAPRVLAEEAPAFQPRDLQLTNLNDALKALEELSAAGEPVSHTAWNWAQTLTHCSQSIEFSMIGFPEPKSALFQNTVGPLAFEFFAWRGRMSHDLAEPIPGAPSIADVTDAAKAEARLREAIATFHLWQAELKPHFAYGELSKAEYEQAHAMHLANHFSWFVAGTEGVVVS